MHVRFHKVCLDDQLVNGHLIYMINLIYLQPLVCQVVICVCWALFGSLGEHPAAIKCQTNLINLYHNQVTNIYVKHHYYKETSY